MREKFNHLYLDSHERKLLIHSLVELKNQLIQQGRYTDCIDELIFKVSLKDTWYRCCNRVYGFTAFPVTKWNCSF